MSRWLIIFLGILLSGTALAKSQELKRAEATLSLVIQSLERTNSDVTKLQVLKDNLSLVTADLEAISVRTDQMPLDKERDKALEDKAKLAEINVLIGSLSELQLHNGRFACGEVSEIIYINNSFPDGNTPASRKQIALQKELTKNCAK
jgi:hypothetical protein